MSLDISALLKQDPDKIILVIALVLILSVASTFGSLIALWRLRARSQASKEGKRIALQERRENAKAAERAARDEILNKLLESNTRFATVMEKSSAAYESAMEKSSAVVMENALALRTLNANMGQGFASTSAELGGTTNKITASIDDHFGKITPTLASISQNVTTIASQVSHMHALVTETKADLSKIQKENTADIKSQVGTVIDQVSKLDESANGLLILLKQISTTVQALKEPAVPTPTLVNKEKVS